MTEKPPVRSGRREAGAPSLQERTVPPLAEDRLLERQQHERWLHREAHHAEPVKDWPDDTTRLFLAQLAFPIMAVAMDSRSAGAVCLSAKFTAVHATSFSLRECRSTSARVRLVLREIERIHQSQAPAVLAIESVFHGQLDRTARQLAKQAVVFAHRHGIRVTRISSRVAAGYVGPGIRSVHDAASVLARRYAALSTRVAPNGVSRLNDAARWRRHRSLVVALCLAHAIALKTMTEALRSRHSAPPPPSPHD